MPRQHCSFSDRRLLAILSTKIYSYTFSKLPFRLINLRNSKLELQDRPTVAKFLTSSEKLKDGVDKIKLMEREAFEDVDYKMSHAVREKLRNEAITRWIKDATGFTVLSHTWQRGELSYSDFRGQKDISGSHLQQLDSDQAQSLHKLHTFCRIAKEYTDFAWADNICIDNSDNPEVDESVRSMFSWYRNAALCIIYLAETNSLLDLVSGHDRWFTRGWTLQELLAPWRLKFYSKDWYRLTNFFNDKISKEDERRLKLCNDRSLSRQLDLLIGTIQKKTGISMEQICSFTPGIYRPPLPERMRWVGRRSTTKEEDQSYSLMGIFNVSIPTAYGEGRERAFFRLFRAILEVGYQRDWFIWAGQSISPSIHPSRMIPSSPECYACLGLHRPNGWTGISNEPIDLTNIGLRMTILFVPAEVNESRELSRFHDYIPPHVTITCPLISNETIEILGMKRPQSDKDANGESEEFALGILNVNPKQLEQDAARYPDRLYAILLQRKIVPQQMSDFSTSYRNWKKCDTDEIITLGHYDKFKLSDEAEGIVSRNRGGTSTNGREEQYMVKIGFRTMYL